MRAMNSRLGAPQNARDIAGADSANGRHETGGLTHQPSDKRVPAIDGSQRLGGSTRHRTRLV
jgi:hypothetical protein